MWKLIIVVILSSFFINNAQAYEYEPYYNRPTRNEKVQNDFSEYRVVCKIQQLS